MPPKKKTCLSDEAYFSLKNKILRGELKSGTALKEEFLAEILKVSRTPLRMALQRLMREGYLVKCPDRTLRIPEISVDELRNICAARKLLEVSAVAEACINVNESNLGKLEYLIECEHDALDKRDTLLVSSLDRTFHEYIAELSGNMIYSDFIQQLNCKVSFFLALSDTLGDVVNHALHEHNEILSALKDKSPDLAMKMMEKHLNNVECRVIESLNKKCD